MSTLNLINLSFALLSISLQVPYYVSKPQKSSQPLLVLEFLKNLSRSRFSGIYHWSGSIQTYNYVFKASEIILEITSSAVRCGCGSVLTIHFWPLFILTILLFGVAMFWSTFGSSLEVNSFLLIGFSSCANFRRRIESFLSSCHHCDDSIQHKLDLEYKSKEESAQLNLQEIYKIANY